MRTAKALTKLHRFTVAVRIRHEDNFLSWTNSYVRAPLVYIYLSKILPEIFALQLSCAASRFWSDWLWPSLIAYAHTSFLYASRLIRYDGVFPSTGIWLQSERKKLRKHHFYPRYFDWQARANSVDPNQTPLNAASDLGLHCLPLRYPAISGTVKLNRRFFSKISATSCQRMYQFFFLWPPAKGHGSWTFFFFFRLKQKYTKRYLQGSCMIDNHTTILKVLFRIFLF